MALRLTGCAVDLAQGCVRTDQGEVRGLTSLEAALMRYLAERPGQDVSREELVCEVWRGERAGRVVDFTVRRLRLKLGEPERPRHILTAHGHGYRFVPLEGDVVEVVRLSEQVIALETGELHLTRRLVVREGQLLELSRVEALLLEELVAHLGQLVPRQQLVQKIWGRGRHEGSLSAAIARLRIKLERDPNAPAVLTTARGHGVRLVGAVSRVSAGYLPAASSSFIARPEKKIATDALSQHRLVTLLGTAGIGKTRLAQEVGASMRALPGTSEVWFFDLTRANSAANMITSVASTLGQEASIDADRVGRMLAARPTGALFVFDNVEQLVDRADIIGAWVDCANTARFLVTSRVPLGLPVERCISLEPLDVSAGVRLFAERSTTDDLDPVTVETLVGRLDGLPLAIELAAALTDRLPVKTVLERIGERLDLLVLRPEGASSQHSTLRGAIDWSWHLLDAPAREVLAAVSLFCAPFDAQAAAAVVGRPIGSALDDLVSRSLLRRVADRWTLFEAIRDFARERLTLAGALQQTIERHAEHFTARAEPLVADLRGRWSVEAIPQLVGMRAELAAALESTHQPSIRGRICRILAARGQGASPRLLDEQLRRALARGVSPEHESYLWIYLAQFAFNSGDAPRAQEAHDRASARADPDDHLLRVRILFSRVREAILFIDWPRATALIGTARAEIEAMPQSIQRLELRAEEAVLNAILDNETDDEEALLARLSLVEEVGDDNQIVSMLRSIAKFYRFRGRFDEASEHYQRALSHAQRSKRRTDERLVHLSIALCDWARGALDRCEAQLDLYDTLLAESGESDRCESMWIRSGLAFERGQHDALLSIAPERMKKKVIAARTALAHTDALRLASRPADAWDVLETLHIDWFSTSLRRAGCSAELGRHDEAQRWLAKAVTQVVPQWYGTMRELALVSALVQLERARGTPQLLESIADARSVLDVGVFVACDDGQNRERPTLVMHARLLLERALSGL